MYAAAITECHYVSCLRSRYHLDPRLASDWTLTSALDATGANGGAETTLKFWDRTVGAPGQGVGPLFRVNTQVDDPHRGAVTCLAHHPLEDVAVTTGSDGDFRIWARQGALRRSRVANRAPSAHWQCRSVASYRGVLPPHLLPFPSS